jgi:hypothetical protein
MDVKVTQIGEVKQGTLFTQKKVEEINPVAIEISTTYRMIHME